MALTATHGNLVYPETAGTSKYLREDGSWVEIYAAYLNRALFDEYTDATTSGTTNETLYSNTLDAGQLAANGDAIKAVYMGTFAANANNKEVKLNAFATAFTGIATTQSGGSWRIEFDVVRVSASAVRMSVQTTYGTSASTEFAEATGLTLANAQTITLDGRTPTSAGDLTARAAKAIYIPAAPAAATPDPLTFLTDGVEFLGTAVSFTP